MNKDGEAFLANVRAALGRTKGSHLAPLGPTARVAPRQAAGAEEECSHLLQEIDKLGGHARRVQVTGEGDGSNADLDAALAALVAGEGIRRATLWSTPGLARWDLAGRLRALGVEIVASDAGHDELAGCDLGVTEVDGALAETGTLLLRANALQPRLVSLLPRVHLALIERDKLRADLRQAFAGLPGGAYAVMVTGPSRTADIELTLTIGVHGPKALHAWLIE